MDWTALNKLCHPSNNKLIFLSLHQTQLMFLLNQAFLLYSVFTTKLSVINKGWFNGWAILLPLTAVLHPYCTFLVNFTVYSLYSVQSPLLFLSVYPLSTKCQGPYNPFFHPNGSSQKPACNSCHTSFSRFSSQLKFSKDFSQTFTDFHSRFDSGRSGLSLSSAEAQLCCRRLNAGVSCARLLR